VNEFNRALCDFCGGDAYASSWLHLEVSRPVKPDLIEPITHEYSDYVDLLFCPEEHAGEYLLQGQLPAIKPYDTDFGKPLTLKERISDWLLVTVVASGLLLSLFLFGLGAWTFVRHLRG
jgi:hypothetical protein